MQLNDFAQASALDLNGADADTCPMTATTHHTERLAFRAATVRDAQALRNLALLDSARPLTGEVVLAEVAGSAVAALSLADGRVVADPFARTAQVSELLRAYAARLRGDLRPRRSPWSLLPHRRHLHAAA